MPGHRTRNGRRGNDPRGANQQRQSAGSRDAAFNAPQGRRGGKASSNISKSTDNIQNGPATQTSLPLADDHGPMPGFNSDAVEAMLKQGYEAKAPLYKPDAKSQGAKSESPWGMKPGAMASGKDFWLDLRKQVTALQQSGGIGQGG
ncbi:uncharacterized protein Z518_09390 [Rhinocladiella mackenziei CBS 650.93]|uniref:Uncharacterized protein n=1 Tax=Rhinocladiella mackenziei CBS 650.93 TaxID=1442369 RepID=A0A0D2I757_9EURO|nr:uncharacterized protein Z518_09390 [Rhinocladiella mackenziei CBS 650.93]KIX01664.1 hypothetical protein Z518_09390 [Rhinocladiella mackenziei CBS 650.93]